MPALLGLLAVLCPAATGAALAIAAAAPEPAGLASRVAPAACPHASAAAPGASPAPACPEPPPPRTGPPTPPLDLRLGLDGAGAVRAAGRREGRPAGTARPPRPARPPRSAARPARAAPGAFGARGRRSRGQVAVAAALGRLGTPFSWGGGSPAGPTRGIGRGARTVGFDCSGLTLYAWARAGVRLAHYTGAQFRQGRRVPRGELRPGDLVFFGGGRGDPTHVGLYLRGGVMVHAPKTGDVVKKTNFARSAYFRARYRGAVRPG